MTRQLKNIVKGMGSLLDIAPEPRTHRYIPEGSDADRLQRDLQRVGQDMYKVINQATHGRRARDAS